MSRKLTKENVRKLPDAPGVYFFMADDTVLYVGKATSLRSRVGSYMRSDVVTSRGPLIQSLMEKATRIDHRETDSVLEALVLEAKLIKKYKPYHNTTEKSNKSFNHVIITKDDYPRVLLFREREILMEKITPKEIKYDFGPFPNGTILRDALRIIRKIFPFRDKCEPAGNRKNKEGKPCFNNQIGLCPGVCNATITKKEYGRTIQHLRLFFEGHKKALKKSLEREMKRAAKEENFELAGEYKRQLFAIDHIQDVSLLKRESDEFDKNTFRIESYDIAHLSGKNTVGVMTVIEDGEVKKSDYRKFRIKSFTGADDTRALKEVLRRRLGHLEWPLPQLFVIDGGKAQRNAARSVLRELSAEVPVVSVVKDEHHQPRTLLGDPKLRRDYHEQILLSNSEAHRFAIKYHKQLRDKIK